MELILYLVFAFSAFALAIGLVVGLLSASTPILLGILVVGILLVQKSINTFNSSQRIEELEKRQ